MEHKAPKHFASVVAIAAFACATLAHADTVCWSDGREETGRIVAGQNARIRLHDGARVLEWDASELAAIAFEPTKETMERAWRFVEAGKTAKEFTGDSYPVIELSACVSLRDGTSVRGHLLTSVLYLEQGAKTSKIVLRRKLRGKEGESYSDIAYPASLAFDPAPSASTSQANSIVLDFDGASTIALEDVACVWRKPFPAAARAWRGDAGELRVERIGGDLVTARRVDGAIHVSWNGECPDEIRRRIVQGVADVRDFFDDRRPLAFASDPDDGTTAFSLVLASRAGGTTLDGAATQPWRLEVWRWRLGDGSNILLSTRAVLFRGLRAASDPLPEIQIDNAGD